MIRYRSFHEKPPGDCDHRFTDMRTMLFIYLFLKINSSWKIKRSSGIVECRLQVTYWYHPINYCFSRWFLFSHPLIHTFFFMLMKSRIYRVYEMYFKPKIVLDGFYGEMMSLTFFVSTREPLYIDVATACTLC